ncbi:MAG: prepilin-type N-terminal cleavage/methylation domain-containing protein [Spongiibacteraceae bacterium]|nr:prepilin-type N-terminal cleavage/methylation domain-containing protein [Spongiibacteraceae bacterium]
MKIQSHSRNSSKGFTFIELVIVIILLGLLAAAAIPRLLDVTDEAEIASLEGVAGGFSSAISMAHAQWAAEGNSSGGATTPADKVAINMDGVIIYMNEFGWPTNTDATVDASADSQSSTECQQVLDSVLQSSPSSTTDRNNRANIHYFISVLDQAGGNDIGNTGDICRFEQVLDSNPTAIATHYFDYDLVDGQVTAVTPSRN